MSNFNTRTLAFAFGGIFLLVSALGFIPNPLVSPDGLFAVNHEHNMVHMMTGIFLLLGALAFAGKEHIVLIIAGVLYGLVGVAGFVTGAEMLFGVIRINPADNVLHIGLATALVLSGIMAPRKMMIAAR